MSGLNPLAGLRFGTDVVSIELAAGGVALGVLAWYRGASPEARYVGVQLLDAPEVVVPMPLEAVTATGRTVAPRIAPEDYMRVRS